MEKEEIIEAIEEGDIYGYLDDHWEEFYMVGDATSADTIDVLVSVLDGGWESGVEWSKQSEMKCLEDIWSPGAWAGASGPMDLRDTVRTVISFIEEMMEE